MIGKTLSRYKITGKLGEGGMGEVYRAEDTELDREVAIKLLPADMADNPERLERFKREAKAVAALNHPNIVTIYNIESSVAKPPAGSGHPGGGCPTAPRPYSPAASHGSLHDHGADRG